MLIFTLLLHFTFFTQTFFNQILMIMAVVLQSPAIILQLPPRERHCIRPLVFPYLYFPLLHFFVLETQYKICWILARKGTLVFSLSDGLQATC